MYRPHNPCIPKMKMAQDSEGNPIKRRNKQGNEYIVRNKEVGKDGKPIMEIKYTYEKLISSRIDLLKNVYVAEQLSHNRSDANIPYNSYL